jgi:hypothetical protein
VGRRCGRPWSSVIPVSSAMMQYSSLVGVLFSLLLDAEAPGFSSARHTTSNTQTARHPVLFPGIFGILRPRPCPAARVLRPAESVPSRPAVPRRPRNTTHSSEVPTHSPKLAAGWVAYLPIANLRGTPLERTPYPRATRASKDMGPHKTDLPSPFPRASRQLKGVNECGLPGLGRDIYSDAFVG